MYGPIIKMMRKGGFVACTDVDEAKAKAFADEYGVERVYASIADLLRDPGVRGVVLATPPFLHAEHTELAARAGKHVFCEKPMARTVSECDEMIGSCEGAGVILAIGQMRRFHKVNRLAKRLIDEGRLGRVFLVRMEWDDPDASGANSNKGYRASFASMGGILQDRAPHTVDLACWWIGSPPASVSAAVRSIAGSRFNEDMVSCTVEHENGAISVFNSTSVSNTPWREEHRIYGTKGTLVITADRLPSISIEPPRMLLYTNGRGRGNCDISDVTPYNELANTDDEQAAHNQYLLELEDFAEAIARGTQPGVGGAEGRLPVEVTNAAYISASTGRKVPLPLTETMDYEGFFRGLLSQPGNHIDG